MKTLAKTECSECSVEFAFDESAVTLYVDPPYAACLRCVLATLTVPQLLAMLVGTQPAGDPMAAVRRQYALDHKQAERVVGCVIANLRGKGHDLYRSLECVDCRIIGKLRLPNGRYRDASISFLTDLRDEYGLTLLQLTDRTIQLAGWANPR